MCKTAIHALGFAFCVVSIGCQSGPPKPTLQMDMANLSARLDTIGLRLGKLEKAVASLSQSFEENEKSSRQGKADQSVVNEDLRGELKTVRGSLDVCVHDVEQVTATNQKVRENLDSRLIELEQRFLQVQEQSLDQPGKTTVDDITRYNDVMKSLKKTKDTKAMIRVFQEFIRDYPRSPLASNAQYQVAELFFDHKNFAHAISEYQILVDRYPQNEKVCEAIFKQGLAFVALSDVSKARPFFLEVRQRCPKTPFAAQAERQLKKTGSRNTRKK